MFRCINRGYACCKTRRLSLSYTNRFYSAASSPISGKATAAGTLAFVKDANIPLYHKFDKSGLFINPIIHGSPLPEYMRQVHKDSKEDKEGVNFT